MTATLAPPREPGSPASASSRRLAERVFRVREFGIVAVLIVFVAVTAAIQPRFLSITNIQFVLVDATIFALLALGETIVVISRNVDLSVGSVLGISAFLTAQLASQAHGIPLPLVFLAGLGIGLDSAPSTACWSRWAGSRAWWSRWPRCTSSAGSTCSSWAAARSSRPRTTRPS
jgi:rhamnose transport system permease protein